MPLSLSYILITSSVCIIVMFHDPCYVILCTQYSAYINLFPDEYVIVFLRTTRGERYILCDTQFYASDNVKYSRLAEVFLLCERHFSVIKKKELYSVFDFRANEFWGSWTIQSGILRSRNSGSD